MKKTQLYDFITAGVIYAISIFFLTGSFSIPTPESRIMPRVYAILLIVCATILVLRRLKNKDNDSYDYSGSHIAVTLIAMMAAYVAASHFVGMYVTTPIFLLGSMYFLGMHSWKVLIPVAVGMDVFIYLVFSVVFKVAIPMGVLFGG